MSINFPNLGTYSSDSFSDRGHNIIRTINTKPAAPALTDDYQYDANNRLVGVSGRLNASYVFPAGSNNNVATYTHVGKVTNATYDAQDRLTKLRGAIERDFQYTADGDLSQISNCLGQKNFEYDFFGHLKKVTLANGTVIRYKIDGLGRRVARLVNGQVKEYYIWQSQYKLGAILDPQGQMQIYYVYGIHPRAPSYMVKNGVSYPMIANERGDIQYVTDGQGQILQEIQYDEYGAILYDSSVEASPTKTPFQPMGWSSGLTDRDTGLVRFGARDYDPQIGRWTSKDPIGFGGGDTNLYSYVGQNPLSYVDPTGLARCTYSISTGRLSCTSNDGKSTGSANMFSGNNDPGSTDYKGGPLPMGKYDITKVPGANGRDWFLDPGLMSRIGYRLGQNRGGFNLHLRKGGSDGCITGARGENDNNFNNINNILNQDAGDNTIEVGF
jgi:RHS repeat-associated protein